MPERSDLDTLLDPFELANLEADGATIYALDPELRIIYVNAAWHRFARDNGASWPAGAWGVGSVLMDAVPPSLRPFYATLLERARVERDPIDHPYECSSPTERRWYRMTIYRCRGPAFLVVSSLLRTEPLVADAPAAGYAGAGGLIVQCSHCRRVRRPWITPETWDFVPAYLERVAANISHGLCAPCASFHYDY